MCCSIVSSKIVFPTIATTTTIHKKGFPVADSVKRQIPADCVSDVVILAPEILPCKLKSCCASSLADLCARFNWMFSKSLWNLTVLIDWIRVQIGFLMFLRFEAVKNAIFRKKIPFIGAQRSTNEFDNSAWIHSMWFFGDDALLIEFEFVLVVDNPSFGS